MHLREFIYRLEDQLIRLRVFAREIETYPGRSTSTRWFIEQELEMLQDRLNRCMKEEATNNR